MRVGTGARIGLGLTVSAGCLWLAVQQAPIAEVGEALGQVSYWWLVPALLLNVAGRWARGCRWRRLLNDRGTRLEYFWAQAIGSLLTAILPLRAGEVGRAVVISQRIGIPLVQVGASVVLERFADIAVMMGLLATLLLMMDVPWQIAMAGLALAASLMAVIIWTAALLACGQRLTGVVEAIAIRLPPRMARFAITGWADLLAAIEPLRQPRLVLDVLTWSLVAWVTGLLAFWTTIEAVVPGARLLEVTFGFLGIAFGMTVPSSPGFVGVFHLLGQQALVMPFPDRFTPASALAIVLLNHVLYYVSSVTLGLLGLARLGLSLRDTRLSAEPEPAAGA